MNDQAKTAFTVALRRVQEAEEEEDVKEVVSHCRKCPSCCQEAKDQPDSRFCITCRHSTFCVNSLPSTLRYKSPLLHSAR